MFWSFSRVMVIEDKRDSFPLAVTAAGKSRCHSQ
jgi:hypothetical protein